MYAFIPSLDNGTCETISTITMHAQLQLQTISTITMHVQLQLQTISTIIMHVQLQFYDNMNLYVKLFDIFLWCQIK